MQTSLVVVLAGLAQQSGPHPLAPPSLTHNGAAWPANSQPKPLHDSKAAGGTLPLNTAPVIADVAVYGASSAGVIAAVAAARAQPSLRVVLLAPTSHIGGITSAGLGCVDAGNGSVVGGFAREFYTRVGQAYGLPHNTAAWRITPAVAQQVFAAMLAEANVTLLTSVGDVQFCGPTDASATPAPAPGTPPRQSAPWVLTTAAGPSTTAAVLIDGTYEADLAYACGATVTWGREARAQYNESNAGVLSEPSPLSAGHCQFNVDLDPYDDAGRLLPLVPSPRPSGPAGEGDDKVMAYTFRVCITNRSDILVPFARPPQYDPNHWTLLARFIEASNFTSVNSLIWRFALPEGKFDVCNYGPLSTMPVGLQWGWPNGTTEERSVIFEAHRSHVAGMLYFLANDPRVPQTIRMDISSFGLCGDEFNATAHWPPELYVREARRLVGRRIFTQHDRAQPIGGFSDAVIGLGGFWFDSVVVDRAVYSGGKLLNEGNYNDYSPKTPFDLPYWLMLPQHGGPPLLAPASPSASHVGFSSLRLEPTLMILGQAAGAAAAAAIQAGVAPADIDVSELQRALRQQKQRVFQADLEPDDWVPCGVV